MIRLDPVAVPMWLDLGHGVRVHVRRAASAMIIAARMSPDALAAAQMGDLAGLEIALTKSVATFAIIEWDGVGDANGEVIEVTPENVALLMDIPSMHDAFHASYLRPIWQLESEKNV